MARRFGIGDLHTPEQIAAMSPEWARAAVNLLIILNGGQIDERPVHPVTGQPMDLPLTDMEAAAVNHSQLANMEAGRKRLAEMNCTCDWCQHWRQQNGIGRRTLPRR